MMSDIFGQPRATGYAAPSRAASVDPDHVTYGRRIAIGLDGQPYEVWDPQVLAEFNALADAPRPAYRWEDERA